MSKKRPIGFWAGGYGGECCEFPRAGRKTPSGLWYICPKGHYWQWQLARKGVPRLPVAAPLPRS